MYCSSHNHWFDHFNNIWLLVEIAKLIIMYFSPAFCYLTSILSTLFSSSLSVETKFHIHAIPELLTTNKLISHNNRRLLIESFSLRWKGSWFSLNEQMEHCRVFAGVFRC
jgi:hypothetical protein